MAFCIFKCGKSDTQLTTAGVDRINTIIESSRLRQDTLHVELQRELNENRGLIIQCHRNCVSTYTSASHISRQLERQGKNAARESNAPPPEKRTRRSEVIEFKFREHCLFCGELCVLAHDSKNPNRWRIVRLCSKPDGVPENETDKAVILVACDRRKDEWANHVQLRLRGAVSDLYAVGARYHLDCRAHFMAPRAIQAREAASCMMPEVTEPAIQVVMDVMKADVAHVWSSTELYTLYKSHAGSMINPHMLLQRLSELFDKDLVVLSPPGIASIIMFRSTASALLRLDETGEEASLTSIASTIVKETKTLVHDKNVYKTRLPTDSGLDNVSTTLTTLLAKISGKLNQSLSAMLIGNIITSLITNQPTSLQVALGVLVREKNLVQSLYDFGVTCSYDEVLRFKASAAKEAATNSALSGISDSSVGLVQAVADNFDANISSQNGLQSTHAMAFRAFDNILEDGTQRLLNFLESAKKSLLDCKYSTTRFSDGVLCEMYRFYKQQEFCDFQIKVEDKAYNVHRLVMASSSDYFKAMLSHDMVETRQESTDLLGISIRGIEPLLDFMYTGRLALAAENIQDVISAATFLQVMPAVDLCIEFLKENMTFENAEELLNIAEVFSIPSLKEYYKNFILTNFLQFAESDAFLRMDAENLAEYLMDDGLVTTSEAILLHHCLRWYNHDRENREKDVFSVVEKVRMGGEGWSVISAAIKVEPFISNPDCQQLIADCEKYMSEAEKRYYNNNYRTRVRSTRRTIIQFGGVTKFDEMYDRSQLDDGLGISNEMYGWDQNNFFHPDLKCWFPLGVCRYMGQRISHQKAVVVNDCAILTGGYEYTVSSSQSSLLDTPSSKIVVGDVKMFSAQGSFQMWDMVKLQHARARHAAASLPGFIYVIGGRDDLKDLTSVERLDCDKEKWSYVKALPRAMCDHAALAVNGKVLVTGGVEKHSVVKNVWCYDPATNKWRKKAQLNCARAGHGMVQLGTHVYVAGGYNSTTNITHTRCLVSVERYDMDTDQWTKVAPLKQDCAHMEMLVFNEKIMVLGGYDSEGQLSTYMYEYDPSLDRWKLYGELPRPLKSVACCAVTVKLTSTGCMEDETDDILEEYERIFSETVHEEKLHECQRNQARVMENFDPGDYLLDDEDFECC